MGFKPEAMLTKLFAGVSLEAEGTAAIAAAAATDAGVDEAAAVADDGSQGDVAEMLSAGQLWRTRVDQIREVRDFS